MIDALIGLAERVRHAAESGTQLRIRGGGTKDFYGEAPQGEVLETTVLEGISSYEPTELVVTARCGTSLTPIHAHSGLNTTSSRVMSESCIARRYRAA